MVRPLVPDPRGAVVDGDRYDAAGDATLDVTRRRAIGEPIPGYGTAGFDRNVLVSVGSAGAVPWSPLLTNERYDALRHRICALTRRNLSQVEQRDFLPDGSYEPTC